MLYDMKPVEPAKTDDNVGKKKFNIKKFLSNPLVIIFVIALVAGVCGFVIIIANHNKYHRNINQQFSVGKTTMTINEYYFSISYLSGYVSCYILGTSSNKITRSRGLYENGYYVNLEYIVEQTSSSKSSIVFTCYGLTYREENISPNFNIEFLIEIEDFNKLGCELNKEYFTTQKNGLVFYVDYIENGNIDGRRVEVSL